MKNKNELHKNVKKNYFKCPNDVFNVGMHIQCVGFYCFLISLPEDFNPSITYLSKRLRISRTTVIRYFNYLEKIGLIKKIEYGNIKNKKVTRYELVPNGQWKF